MCVCHRLRQRLVTVAGVLFEAERAEDIECVKTLAWCCNMRHDLIMSVDVTDMAAKKGSLQGRHYEV